AALKTGDRARVRELRWDWVVSPVAESRLHGSNWRNVHVKYKLIITSAAAALLAGTVLAAGQGMPRQQPGAQDQGAQGQQPSQTEQRGRQGAQKPSDRPSTRTQGQGQREQGQAQGAQREGQSQSPSKQSQTPSKKQTQAPSNRQTPSTTGQGPREQGQREEGRQGQQGQRQRDREPARRNERQ